MTRFCDELSKLQATQRILEQPMSPFYGSVTPMVTTVRRSVAKPTTRLEVTERERFQRPRQPRRVGEASATKIGLNTAPDRGCSLQSKVLEEWKSGPPRRSALLRILTLAMSKGGRW